MKDTEKEDLFLKAARGKLTEEERAHLEDLVSGDMDARNDLEEERALESLLDTLPSAPVPSNFNSLRISPATRI